MTQRTRRTKYPWTLWTDGEVHRIVRGQDYSISTYHLQISLHGRARTEGKRVSTRSFTERGRDAEGYVTESEGITFQYWTEEK